MLRQKRGRLLCQDKVFHHVDLNPEEKNYQPQCKIMISVHVDLPISQRLPKFQGRVLPDLDCSQAILTPFSPIEVIEIEPRRIESRTRFGVCHEYIVVSDRDTCNGLLNFRVRHTPLPDASGGENDDEMDAAEPTGLRRSHPSFSGIEIPRYF